MVIFASVQMWQNYFCPPFLKLLGGSSDFLHPTSEAVSRFLTGSPHKCPYFRLPFCNQQTLMLVFSLHADANTMQRDLISKSRHDSNSLPLALGKSRLLVLCGAHGKVQSIGFPLGCKLRTSQTLPSGTGLREIQ